LAQEESVGRSLAGDSRISPVLQGVVGSVPSLLGQELSVWCAVFRS